MNQRKVFLDSQSDQFEHSQQRKSSKLNKYEQQSSSDIHNDSPPESQSDRSQNQDQQQQSEKDISKQQILEKQIMKIVCTGQQKKKPFQRELMAEMFEKLKNYETASCQKQGEQLLTLRIQELVYNKLLVLTYGCSDFRLVLSHFHLGHAYLRHGCVDQAIEHISIALHKNQKLFKQVSQTKLFNCLMVNILAECLIKKEQFDDAIEVLKKSIDISSEMNIQNNNSNVMSHADEINNRAKILLAQCYCKLKQYGQSIRIVEEVVHNASELQKQEFYAFALVEKANILAAKGDYQEAIGAQDQAINILIKVNYRKPEQVAEMYVKLGEYFQQIGNAESSLSCIKKAKTLYEQTYSKEDKKVIKARRKIATCLLKNDRFKEAAIQLLEIAELEEKVFGESSLQKARTLKLLGTVYIKFEAGDARAYLKKAMNIFNVHGNKKQVEEIKEKLRILMESGNNNNDLKMMSEQDL